MKLALSAVWTSFVRTAVPFVVAWIMSLVILAGLEPDPEFETNLSNALTLTLGAAYHLAIRLLEVHVSPHFGWLLGSAKQPLLYAKPDAAGVPVITSVAETPSTTTVTIATDPTSKRDRRALRS